MGVLPIFYMSEHMTTLYDTSVLEKLVTTSVQAARCQLWGYEWVMSHKQNLLRVYIEETTDKLRSVTIDHCVNVHHQLKTALRVEAPFLKSLQLEVSSPGLARRLFRLSHYQRYINERLRLSLRQPHAGRKHFVGQLKSVQGDNIVLQTVDDTYTFEFDNICKAHLVVD